MENKMKPIFYTVEEGRIGRIKQTDDDTPPGPEWKTAPGDWQGNQGDKLEWFDKDMRRFGNDDKLVELGLRKNNKGRVFNIITRASRIISDYDVDLKEDETKEPPIENETYQKFDRQKNKWIVETAEKDKAKRIERIGEKQAAIDDAERRIQRSMRAKLSHTATEKDDKIFAKINEEIDNLREEKQKLQAED